MGDSFVISHLLFVVPFFVWALSEVLKRLLRYGRMPSSHTALITSVTTVIAFTEGVFSSLFIVSLAVSGIVMYDAMMVRRQVGLHAEALNKNLSKKDKKFRTDLGHTFWEVAGGAFLGVFLSILLWKLLGI